MVDILGTLAAVALCELGATGPRRTACMTEPASADDRASAADDELWLIGPDAAPHLAEAAASDADELGLLARLRKRLSPARARLVVEQTVLRRRAREKFTHADKLFFTAVGLEQATDEVTANYKAARFKSDSKIVDFCCGIGGDLLALGKCTTVVGIDRDPVVVARAAANCRAMQEIHGGACGASATQASVDPRRVAECDAWHIDPDRRPGGRRTTHVELHEPGLDMLNAMLQLNPHAAVKLAPAAEVPPSWTNAECEWISRRGECKQLVTWFGGLAQSPGMHKATTLADDGTSRSLVGPAEREVPAVAELGKFLYEPDAAVLAADLVATLAREYQIAAVHPGSVYLTGDVAHRDPLLATFEIMDAIAFDQKRLRAALAARDIGRLEIKKRGLDVDVARLRRELQLRGAAEATLILVRRGDRVTSVVARRVVS